ncbi:polyprenyl synthetase family protein [Lacticaseibacillus manihotivorans]|uniref:Trans-hexaprenyltranstransferase, component II n=2 Tax=Lacticaseibacillus manihotivorans TaxID=88233 RepID=A0A0R1QWM3_9LACO|nr:polyprenyl synthetase family protein [Lacticaseibacillus manihotivorans]KRL45635.1 trans-hexaprenyltranstransferase, component II [Lacticaseibacillus manihotivorans DSM 13343 = JCM 12514]QFQ90408.1 polyprenyl synthetase family protein [Lacticaseibacillus manihotivorans]
MLIHPMWADYPEVASELTATLQLIQQEIKPQNTKVADALVEMINAGGKLLRPAYCLLFSQFAKNRDADKMIALAAAVEALHNATLVHDDIIDKSKVRRGLPTISAQFGEDVAVYAGDYLFVVCFKLIAKYASDLRSVQQDAGSMEKLLNGELEQMATRYNYDMDIDHYLSQVSGKTGQLFALSSFIGTYESGQSLRFAKKVEKIGLNIGIAFQLLDDILDYTADADTLGKPVHEDMKQGVYSAPLILAMSQNRAAFLPYLQKQHAMTADDLQAVMELVAQYQGVEQARAMAAVYTQQALNGLAGLPEAPVKHTLIRLTEQLLRRRS